MPEPAEHEPTLLEKRTLLLMLVLGQRKIRRRCEQRETGQCGEQVDGGHGAARARVEHAEHADRREGPDEEEAVDDEVAEREGAPKCEGRGGCRGFAP